MGDGVEKERILSGMRPTGKLHLGNLHGALLNWVELQDKYHCFYFIADWHALTTEFASTGLIKESALEMVIDWLAVGLDPDRTVMFQQSSIKEHAELFLLLAMITPVAWLERNPPYKEMLQELAHKEINNLGFLGYPVLMAADILIYKAHAVPVGVDQLPHVEFARELARRFNHLYAEVFPEPRVLLTETPKLLGIDGRKMGKSYENAIFIGDEPQVIKEKVMRMVTDPQRARRSDPGRPEVCNVFTYHKLYSSEEEVERVDRDCRTAGIGCVECKGLMAANLIEALTPIRERRRYYEEHLEEVQEVLEEGNRKARAFARDTLEEVRAAMKL